SWETRSAPLPGKSAPRNMPGTRQRRVTMPEDEQVGLDEEQDDSLTGYAEEEDNAPLETDEAEAEPEDIQPEPQPQDAQAQSQPYRPQFADPAQAEAYLREIGGGEEMLAAVNAIIEARLANSRQGEAVSGHYASQIDAAAPNFLGVEERTMLRQMTPMQ